MPSTTDDHQGRPCHTWMLLSPAWYGRGDPGGRPLQGDNFMVYLTRRATFSASHRLWSNHLTEAENYATYDKCANPHGHGHNYVLEVTVRGEPDPRTGMVLNLSDLKRIMNERVVDGVDHKHLNYDVPWLEGVIPTTEMLVIK